jgi:hypothetical protein
MTQPQGERASNARAGWDVFALARHGYAGLALAIGNIRPAETVPAALGNGEFCSFRDVPRMSWLVCLLRGVSGEPQRFALGPFQLHRVYGRQSGSQQLDKQLSWQDKDSACHAEGRGFESRGSRHFDPVGEGLRSEPVA